MSKHEGFILQHGYPDKFDWLHIGGIVSINTVTGDIKYHEGYTPDEAARIFWDALRNWQG